MDAAGVRASLEDPRLRFSVTLRDPIARAVSHLNFMRRFLIPHICKIAWHVAKKRQSGQLSESYLQDEGDVKFCHSLIDPLEEEFGSRENIPLMHIFRVFRALEEHCVSRHGRGMHKVNPSEPVDSQCRESGGGRDLMSCWGRQDPLGSSRYFEQFEWWFAYFPRDMFLVLPVETDVFPATDDLEASERLSQALSWFYGMQVSREIQTFPRVKVTKDNQGEQYFAPMDVDDLRELEEYYRREYDELHVLLGLDKPLWQRPSERILSRN
eukprot:TRINITY_DN8104_c0_g1_i1.p1 TRINITY_DN8104_c0_g1~~TRINITY_DN8104_c0_g1_i1.p1  ORF type:complete len:268 (-),score=47.87 TRINITY_DN8104_c0_g1_i1:148-951(-)